MHTKRRSGDPRTGDERPGNDEDSRTSASAARFSVFRAVRARWATVAGVAGVAVASMAAVALASSLTLGVADHAPVTNTAGVTSHKNIVITSSGFAVYTLTGDSARHPECTKAKGCFQFWPPVTISASAKLTKSAAIKGTLGRWHRDGFTQLTLSGHPLYRFRDDNRPRAATGEGIVGFGGTWHVVSTGSD